MRGAVTTPGLSTRDYKRNVAPASARPLDYYNPRTHAAQASHGGSAVVAGRAKILDGERLGERRPRRNFPDLPPVLPRAFHLGEQFRISARQAVIFVGG